MHRYDFPFAIRLSCSARAGLSGLSEKTLENELPSFCRRRLARRCDLHATVREFGLRRGAVGELWQLSLSARRVEGTILRCEVG
jgi:hypothetical protein